MSERVVWDKYETALLIDMFWKIENEEISKAEGVQQLSLQLRQMAINQGRIIDDVYRNCNGIVMQLASIQKLFFPQRSGLTVSKLFIEMVDLYKSNHKEFDCILKEAKRMCAVEDEEINYREAFSQWLIARDIKIPPVALILESFDIAGEYAIKRNLSKKTFWELSSINDFNTLRAKLLGMKLFRLMHPSVAKTMDKTWRHYVSFLEDIPQESRACVVDSDNAVLQAEETASLIVQQIEDKDSIETDISKPKLEDTKEQSFGATYYPPAVKSKKDKELFKKYPDVLLKTYDLFSNSIRGYYTVDTLMIKLEKRATFKIVEDILDNASWLRKDGIKYFFDPEVSKDVVKDVPEKKLNDYSLSEQVISEQPIEVIDVKSTSVKVDESSEAPIVNKDDFVQPITIERNETKDISFADWLLNVQGMPINSVRSYTSAINGISSYAYFNAWIPVPLLEIEDNEQLKLVIGLLLSHPDFCAYNVGQHNRFSAALRKYLVYRTGTDDVIISHNNCSTKLDNQKSKYADGIISLLDKRFKYGFRLESPIDLMRARQFAKDEGIDLPENDEELKKEISNAGISIDGRIYVIGDDTITELKDMLQRIIGEGHTLIFYETFREKEAEWFESKHILTDDMLKELLVKHQEGFFYGKNFMSSLGKTTEIDGIADELKRVWGEQVLLTFDEMDERLPYIPPERVRHALSMHKDMIWNSEATYTMTDRVVISEDEKQSIRAFASNACDLNGFSSMSDLPLDSVFEENYELSLFAVHEAVYLLVLQNDFQLNGKIITRHNAELSAVDLLKNYCADKEQCTLDELLEKVIELTGASNRQYAFEAGYSAMVRVEQNLFVADNRVAFNVDEIDALLEDLIPNDFVAIRSISAFAIFPLCGQPWSSYLLENYCYKYSKKFRLRNMNFNDKNAGIICKRSLDLDYLEMCAIALAKSKVELTIEAAGRYLCDEGYLAKSKYARMGDIVERAREIREEF